MADYWYTLPQTSIAQRPLSKRDQSRLLVVNADTLAIRHHLFADLPDLLLDLHQSPRLVLNQSKVVPARLAMVKPTGGEVEVLLIQPVAPHTDPQVVLSSTSPSVWKCMIGGRNIQAGMVLVTVNKLLSATVLSRDRQEGTVELTWHTAASLSEILDQIGHIPLPPYIGRADDPTDRSRYQTVFATTEGSAAAPTAGLHFTDELLSKVESSGAGISRLTLHVGMGTFRQVESATARDHSMHSERVTINIQTVTELASSAQALAPCIIPVGTTSMRSIESAYWIGSMLANAEDVQPSLIYVPQFAAVDSTLPRVSAADSFAALRNYMVAQKLSELSFNTQLMVAPGASIGVTNGLITNFHQPGSTLLLLVAALLGKGWRSVYQTALDEGYRFLSYGDAMLIMRTHDG